MVKNLPSGAGDASSIPGQGIKIPHAAGQLSPGTVTSESLQVKSKTQCSNPPPKKKKENEEDTRHDAVQELRRVSRFRAVGSLPSQKGTRGCGGPGRGHSPIPSRSFLEART